MLWELLQQIVFEILVHFGSGLEYYEEVGAWASPLAAGFVDLVPVSRLMQRMLTCEPAPK